MSVAGSESDLIDIEASSRHDGLDLIPLLVGIVEHNRTRSSPPPPQLDDLGRLLGLTMDARRCAHCLQRLGLLVLILMKVVGADDAGWPVRKHGFGDVVRDAQCRQTGANDAAQIVVDPSRQIDGVMILAATAGQRLQGPQHAPVEVGLDRAGHRQWPLARARSENRNGPFLMRGTDAMTSRSADDIGTRCSRALPSRPFILDAGMMMVLP